MHRTAVLRAEGEIVAMLTAIPFETDRKQGAYLYAVCTHPQHRGRGYMRQLMQGVCSLLAQEGVAFCLLVPANEEMEETYRRMGFTDFMPIYRGLVAGQTTMQVQSLSYEEFAHRHRAWSQKQKNAVCWPDEVLQYQYREMCALGGGAAGYVADGDQYYVAYTRNGNTVYMLEDSGPDPFMSAAAVAAHEGAEMAQVRITVPCERTDRYPPVMGKPLADEWHCNGYASFLMDV